MPHNNSEGMAMQWLHAWVYVELQNVIWIENDQMIHLEGGKI